MSENRELMRKYSDIVLEAEVATKVPSAQQQEVDRANSVARRAQNPVASGIGDAVGGALGDVVAGGRAAWDSGVNAFNKKVTPIPDPVQGTSTPKPPPPPLAPTPSPGPINIPAPRARALPTPPSKPMPPASGIKPPTEKPNGRPGYPEFDEAGRPIQYRVDVNGVGQTQEPEFDRITKDTQPSFADEPAIEIPSRSVKNVDLTADDEGAWPMNRRGFIPDPNGTRESAGETMRKLADIVSEAKDPENVKKSSKDLMKPYKA